MNGTVGDREVIVRHPTALEAAGATIVSGPDVWIPRTGARRGGIADGCGNGAGMESQTDFHTGLEISHRTRDSHIPTSRFLLSY